MDKKKKEVYVYFCRSFLDTRSFKKFYLALRGSPVFILFIYYVFYAMKAGGCDYNLGLEPIDKISS